MITLTCIEKEKRKARLTTEREGYRNVGVGGCVRERNWLSNIESQQKRANAGDMNGNTKEQYQVNGFQVSLSVTRN